HRGNPIAPRHPLYKGGGRWRGGVTKWSSAVTKWKGSRWSMIHDIVENDGWTTRLPAVSPDGQPTSNAVAASGERDAHGRFLAGNSGGGRRKGSRNKLTERFLDAIADDFLEHGPEAIAKVRMDDPAMYLK